MLELLRSELRALAAQTLALASDCRLERGYGTTGQLSSVLAPTPEELAAARANNERLQRWRTVVSSAVRRRGVDEGHLQSNIDRLSELVLLQRPASIAVRRPQWRKAFEQEVETLRIALERLLSDLAPAVVPLQRTSMPSVTMNLHVCPDDGGTWRVEAVAGASRATETVGALAASEIDDILCTYCGPDQPKTSVSRTLEVLMQFGRRLFGVIFQGSVAALYEGLRGSHVQMEFSAGSLAHVPWELMHDGAQFLALGRDTAIWRGLPGPSCKPIVRSDVPLRILLTISSPGGLLSIDRQQERRTVEEAVAPWCVLGAVQLDVARDGSMAALRRLMRDAESEGRPYHVWHFAGHGRYDGETGRSVIAFTGDDGQADWAGGPELSTIFGGATPLRAVVLKACEGARGDVASRWCDLVPSFLDSGIETVVAMRFELSYEASATFDREFYGAIAEGASLDEALRTARAGLIDQANYTEWITPLIFRRGG